MSEAKLTAIDGYERSEIDRHRQMVANERSEIEPSITQQAVKQVLSHIDATQPRWESASIRLAKTRGNNQ